MRNNVNPQNRALGQVRSVIRETFEYGRKRAAEIGPENVFDFSLGNPSIPAPEKVNETLQNLLENTDSVVLHGYTSAAGDPVVRQAVADSIRTRFGCPVTAGDIYMTCGAAASLTVALHALVNPGDEVVVIAPFFPEYRVFAEGAGARLRVVAAEEKDFQIDFAALEHTLTPATKAVIVNSPNNPTGVIYTSQTVRTLCDLLRRKSQEYGAPIYLLADEPYRELCYDADTVIPYLPCEYDNTLVCYSFSKSLSLPGERIGYIALSPTAQDKEEVYAAILGAGRMLGFVCAPSLMQKMLPACLGEMPDLAAYRENRDLLYGALTEYGFSCVRPDGAFYLFVRSPLPDAAAFCRVAAEEELLLVPSDSFGCPGYVRIAYCVSTEMIRRSLPAFRRLAERTL